MATAASDVQKTLKFGTGFYNAVLLGLFVVCAPITAWLEGWWMLALCVAGALFQLGRVILARPALALTPDGIVYNFDGISYAIPWPALLNVEARDIPSSRDVGQFYKDTTVLTVSRKFYEEHIHSAFGVLLNPSRGDYFNFEGNTVQIALHHGFMRLEPKYLRGEVEARWRAFAPARAGKANAVRAEEATS